MNYTTYLFDFDYTLAASSRGIVTCIRNVHTRHGYTQPTDDDIKRTIGKTLEDSFSILFYRCRRCFVLWRFLPTGACLCMGIKCLSVCFS